MDKRVLILGADGFIGRHIAFCLHAQGWDVLASARRVNRLRHMGFEVVEADLCDPATHDPGFWAPHVRGRKVVNAAGLLSASDPVFEAVHVKAPSAVYVVAEGGVLISAVGVGAATPFAEWRMRGEAEAQAGNVTVLRAGLVMADTSYGGTSLARGLAAMPFCVPVVGSGTEPFNPIHAADLAEVVAECLETPPGKGAWEIGGAEEVSQIELLSALRSWMGLAPARVLALPNRVAMALGRLGDALRLGPISTAAVVQLDVGVVANSGPLLEKLTTRPRGMSRFLRTRPAGSQDLWHARLFLLRPCIRLVLAFLWIASGLLGLFLPSAQFLPLVAGSGVADGFWIALARLGGVADLAIAAALVRNWRPQLMGLVQLGLVGTYTLAFTLIAPALWLLPIGGLLKNLPILVLILVWMALEDER